MAIYINTNTQSVFAQRSLGKNTMGLQKSIEKLSTGSKINRAADDAAGLSIATKLSSQIIGVEQADKNIGDGISMVQTAEGALSIVQENLQRVRELAVQAANGTNSENELAAIQREVNARVLTIEDIANSTEFNGINLLDGTAGVINLQTGANQGNTTAIDLTNFDVNMDTTAVGSIGEGADELDEASVGSTTVQTVSTTFEAANSLTEFDTMLDNVSRMRSELGAIQNSLETRKEFLNVFRNRSLASRSRIMDADMAKESSAFVKNQILQQSSAAMLSQANAAPQLALNLLP